MAVWKEYLATIVQEDKSKSVKAKSNSRQTIRLRRR